MFSLGHSTIVVIGSIAIAATTLALQHGMSAVTDIGGVIGTLLSTLFLFALAIANLIVLRAVYLTFMRVRLGEPYVEEDLDLLLCNRGFFARILRPVFGMIRYSWHMYTLGMLFGLASTQPPRSVCWASPQRRLPGACRSGRSWCFQPSSPQGCR